MHTLVKACTYLRDSDTDNEIRKSLGMTTYVHYDALNNIDHDNVVRPIAVCNRSEDFKFKESTILTFCHSEESSSIDSNCRRIVPITVNGVEEQHVGRA